MREGMRRMMGGQQSAAVNVNLLPQIMVHPKFLVQYLVSSNDLVQKELVIRVQELVERGVPRNLER
jgi:hypothetical protein